MYRQHERSATISPMIKQTNKQTKTWKHAVESSDLEQPRSFSEYKGKFPKFGCWDPHCPRVQAKLRDGIRSSWVYLHAARPEKDLRINGNDEI